MPQCNYVRNEEEGFVYNVCKGQMMTIATKENGVFKILCTSYGVNMGY